MVGKDAIGLGGRRTDPEGQWIHAGQSRVVGLDCQAQRVRATSAAGLVSEIVFAALAASVSAGRLQAGLALPDQPLLEARSRLLLRLQSLRGTATVLGT